MLKLQFPEYNFKLLNRNDTIYIYDPIRHKYIILQPEEWVRQHVIQFLIRDKGYPKSWISVEGQIVVGNLKKRYDLVVFNKQGEIEILVECKAPQVTIDQKSFDQVARYQLELGARWLMLTNGLNHYYCFIEKGVGYRFVKELPEYQSA